MLKENKGVTLVALIVTVIVLLILSGIGMYYGIDSIKTANNNALKSEVIMVQHAVLERYSQYKLTRNNEILVGTPANSEAASLASQMEVTLKGGTYYKLNSNDLNNLGITNSTDTYIVNYETGEVLNATHIETMEGEKLYTSTN